MYSQPIILDLPTVLSQELITSKRGEGRDEWALDREQVG